jgi:hypothetical protein
VPNVPRARKSFWPHPRDLLGDVGQMEAYFGPFGDSVNLDTRQVHGLRRTHNTVGNCFACTRWNFLVTWVKWNFISVRLQTMLLSVQGRCTICAEYTMGMEVFLATPDAPPRWRGSNGTSFWSFQR